MKRFNLLAILLSIIFMITFPGCPPEPGPESVPDFTDESAESTYSGVGDAVFTIETTSGDVDLTHTLHLGASTADVYYVFTNTDPYDDHFNPIIDYTEEKNEPTYRFSPEMPENTGMVGIMGKPEITEYNAHAAEIAKKGVPRDTQLAPEPPVKVFYDVGDPETFMYDSVSQHFIDAHCRADVMVGTKTLYIFVADNCWDVGDGNRTYNITQTMVDAMADKYLTGPATNDDINDWNTAIFGEEWEAYAHTTYPTYFIEDTNDITILLYDIDNDDVPSGAITLGFFWAKDNFLNTALEPLERYSNERIMFYIDAVMFAYNNDGDAWSIDEYWPAMQISTLAHEGQHMIHFYQKAIKSDNGGYLSDTWLNEMCSVTAEDFLADKILADGPRGVTYSDGSAGSPNNTAGRLGLYNYRDDVSLTEWNQELYNYSCVYSYGAYLARNYGGVELFQEIVQDPAVDYEAVENAIAARGYGSVTFAETLRKWGASVLLSDNLLPPANYQYNSGNYFVSSIGGISYNLGSINLYNYKDNSSGQVGPYIYTTSPVGDTRHDEFPGASNRFYLVGENLTGDVTHTVKMEDGVKLTVVVKD
jgi:hypothetical protein